MAHSEEKPAALLPLMLPFQDKEGAGWHVTIRYLAGHERCAEGFATKDEALKWIASNFNQSWQYPEARAR
jgi:hypothetical protein